MTLSASPPALQEDLDYLLRRVAVYLGAREALFADLCARRLRCDGWLAVEAFYALSRPYIARQRFPSVELAGPTQGGSEEEPDLRLQTAGGSRLSVWLRSLPVPAGGDLASLLPGEGGLGPALERLARSPDGVLLSVVYPMHPEDSAWAQAVEQACARFSVRRLDQVFFLLPGPDRVTVALWRPAE